jgi:hypothetical protein
MRTVFDIAMIVLLLFLIYRMVSNWRAANGAGFWEKLKSSFDHSITVLWGWLLAIGGQIVLLADILAQWLNAPEVSSWIKANLSPEVAAIGLSAIGLLTILARLRSILGVRR